MASPEQSRPGKTGRTDLDARARSASASSSEPDQFGPEPEANQPGHHPTEEQDQPPLDDFAARLGIAASPPSAGSGELAGAPPEVASETEDDRGDDHVEGGFSAPHAARHIWSLAVRRGVLPLLGGVRAITDVLERAARDSIR